MKLLRRWKILGALLVAAILLSVIFVWNIGAVLVAPSNRSIGGPPAGLPVENVEFPSASGATLYGWFLAGQPGQGAIVLMHGIHADRTTLVARAEFLSRAGYAVLLFDFQAHGENDSAQPQMDTDERR
jgi:dipeptidyl aminopeptidase/acylaminoacyl peptidase